MATAEQTLPVAASPLQVAVHNFTRLPPQQKLFGLAGVALAIALLVGLLLWARTPDYAVLFSNLSEKDGGAIIAALEQQNVPYKFSPGDSAILVPSGQVHDARLRLASQGLPKGGLVGFELMENQKLGISQFAEQINYQRGLEGELARSIQSLGAVAGARVHLAIPKQTSFLRDEQKPSASVLVNLHAGRVLDPGQVAGIAHLVSSSVPQLAASAVTVIDQDGNLLSQQKDVTRTAGLDPAQLKYIHDVEQGYIRRIETILEPITGSGNVRAQVAADVDFDHTEQTAETYRPNPPAQAAIRSQQSNDASTTQPGAAGVPGALSNQPPVPATAPLTTPPAPGTPAANGALPINSNRSSTVNYELDKTIRHVRGAIGMVKRLSVAVVVNHRIDRLPDGKVRTTPLTEAQMQQINDLVREAMGFSKDRGDTVSVANTPFSQGEKAEVAQTPIWENPRYIDLALSAAKWLLAAIVAFYLLFRVVKPMLRSLTTRPPAPPAPEPSAAEEDFRVQFAAAGGPTSFEHKVAYARQLAKDDPKLVANVIKQWVGSNEQK